MKKQYRSQHTYGFRVFIYLYHDGELIETKKFWEDDEYFNFIDNLKENGYKEVKVIITTDEVEEARVRYECMLDNMIEVKNE